MKKIRLFLIIVFIVIPVIAAIFIFQNNQNNSQSLQFKKKGFVEMENGRFKLNGKPFFPMALNYIINFREIDHQIYVSPDISYDSVGKFDATTPKEINNRLNAHFELISEMGFNTIRLIGIDRVLLDRNNHQLEYAYGAYNKYEKADTIQILKNKKAILIGLERLVKIAGKHHLKLMMLLPKSNISNSSYNSQRLKYIKSILSKFSNQAVVFAYDFFNEPLYFDNHPNEIKDIKYKKFRIVTKWKMLMHQLAPYQLFTIGYAEPLEVFRWDPSIMPVDFLSFHTYNPMRVPNEIYWYSHFVKKPWMIGETGLPADNDSISYLLQKQFMKEVLRRTVNCGGIGFGWWQFQDEPVSSSFEAHYTPLLNHKGITRTEKGNYVIYGSLKPAAYVVKKFLKDYKATHQCPCEDNYYNMLGYSNYLIKGKIINRKTDEPVYGAVVRGWNKNWSIGQNTFTNKNGFFTLYSNDECVHFEISAPGMQTVKFDDTLDYKSPNNIPVNKLKLPNKKLEYQHIDFRNLLKYRKLLSDSSLFKKKNNIIFNFNDSLLHNYKLKTGMKTIKLKPVGF